VDELSVSYFEICVFVDELSVSCFEIRVSFGRAVSFLFWSSCFLWANCQFLILKFVFWWARCQFLILGFLFLMGEASPRNIMLEHGVGRRCVRRIVVLKFACRFETAAVQTFNRRFTTTE